MIKAAVFLLNVALAQDLGPGNGPWEVVSPESQGLSTAALAAADTATERDLSNRVCFLVAKNGKIVHERYMNGGTLTGTRAAWSITKSMCSSLFGIAAEQGWADVRDPVTRVSNTRSCNRAATFENVLTMTGQSNDPVGNPRYSYDTFGTACLDTIQDFIRDNNPDGLATSQWMRNNWYDVLGMEHMSWGPAAGNLGCGFGASVSCRDLLRAGQLWTNNGVWDVDGRGEQLMAENFAQTGVTPVFPNSGSQYGYTLPLRPTDAVDPRRGEMNGMNAQCVLFSRAHNAVIVTMGTGGSCNTAWTNTRAAIVADDHPSFNATRSLPPPSQAQLEEDEAAFRHDILVMAPMMRKYADQFLPEDLARFNEQLVRFGGEAIIVNHTQTQ